MIISQHFFGECDVIESATVLSDNRKTINIK